MYKRGSATVMILVISAIFSLLFIHLMMIVGLCMRFSATRLRTSVLRDALTVMVQGVLDDINGTGISMHHLPLTYTVDKWSIMRSAESTCMGTVMVQAKGQHYMVIGQLKRDDAILCNCELLCDRLISKDTLRISSWQWNTQRTS